MQTIFFTTTFTSSDEALRAVYLYAALNQSLLLNNSAFVFRRGSLHENERAQFAALCPVYEYGELDELDQILKTHSANVLYCLKEGRNDGLVSRVLPTIVHCLESCEEPHGSLYLAASSFVSGFSKTSPQVLPLPVMEPVSVANFRRASGLTEKTVFGVLAKDPEFDLPYLRKEIAAVALKSPDKHFLVCGITQFCEMENVTFLPLLVDSAARQKFINSCDVLIEGRAKGESFGLICAEFSRANRPVIAFREGAMQGHIGGLGSSAFYYSNAEDLRGWLDNFKIQPGIKWAGYDRHPSALRVMDTFERLIAVPLRGGKMNLAPTEEAWGPFYDTEPVKSTYEFILRMAEEGDWIVDCAAGTGRCLEELSSKVGASGKVIAVESQALPFHLLRSKAAQIKLDNVQVLKGVAGDRSGVTRLVPLESGIPPYEAFASGGNEGGEETPLVRIEAYEWPEPIKILKLDSRGAEYFSLEGARQTILRDRPIIALMLSVERLSRYGTSPEKLLEIVREHHYELILSKEGEAVFAVPRERFEAACKKLGGCLSDIAHPLIRKIFDRSVEVETPAKEGSRPVNEVEAPYFREIAMNIQAPNLNLITAEALNRIDLNVYTPLLDDFTKEWFFLEAGKEHYRLLAHLSGMFPWRTLVDIGTNRGGSAIALSHDPRTRVISYDIVDNKTIPVSKPNVEFRLKDVRSDIYEIMAAPLICLDTFHDGTFEREFYRFLQEHGYKGLLVLDDIYLNPEMKSFWADIRHPKVDLTAIGHWSGTGLVYF